MNRRLAVPALLALSLLGCAAPAMAASDYTWTGRGASESTNSERWSRPANWNPAPPFGQVGTLTFPALHGACPSLGCYRPVNDIAGISADAIVLDDGHPPGVGYDIEGKGVTLGAGGLTATTAFAGP